MLSARHNIEIYRSSPCCKSLPFLVLWHKWHRLNILFYSASTFSCFFRHIFSIYGFFAYIFSSRMTAQAQPSVNFSIIPNYPLFLGLYNNPVFPGYLRLRRHCAVIL